MQEQILVPLDGSAFSATILPHAQELARSTGRGLTLLHVVPAPGPAEIVSSTAQTGAPFSDWDEETRSAHQYLGTLSVALAAQGLAVQTRVRLGDPAEGILGELAANPNVTLIAMATHGRGGLLQRLLGGTAERVLAGASVPVLLLRPQPVSATQPAEDGALAAARSGDA